MPNHVHLIVVPESEEGLAQAIGEAHRRYTLMINFREKWRGHLWQERFTSFPMLGHVTFVDNIEALLARTLRPQKP